jgi:hypothetical protein
MAPGLRELIALSLLAGLGFGLALESAASHDALYQRITSSSDEAIKFALGLVDEADKAAQKMVAECETLLEAVRQGTEQIRSAFHSAHQARTGNHSDLDRA